MYATNWIGQPHAYSSMITRTKDYISFVCRCCLPDIFAFMTIFCSVFSLILIIHKVFVYNLDTYIQFSKICFWWYNDNNTDHDSSAYF